MSDLIQQNGYLVVAGLMALLLVIMFIVDVQRNKNKYK